MNIVDIVILVLVGLSAFAGFRSGLIRSVFSLVGLVVGVVFASWQYRHFSDDVFHITKNKTLSEAIWFCLLAIAVMLAASLLGWMLRGAVHGAGLGWLDRLLGLAFGFVRGAVLVTLGIATLAAFYPETSWLKDSQLARYFLTTTRMTTNITPEELRHKILDGLHILEKDASTFMHEK